MIKSFFQILGWLQQFFQVSKVLGFLQYSTFDMCWNFQFCNRVQSPTVQAAPPISVLIWSILRLGLIDIPPLAATKLRILQYLWFVQSPHCAGCSSHISSHLVHIEARLDRYTPTSGNKTKDFTVPLICVGTFSFATVYRAPTVQAAPPISVLIWSILRLGLIDIPPLAATKLRILQYLWYVLELSVLLPCTEPPLCRLLLPYQLSSGPYWG